MADFERKSAIMVHVTGVMRTEANVSTEHISRFYGLRDQRLVMHRLGVIRIVTADADFGRVPGIIRLDPADDREWRQA